MFIMLNFLLKIKILNDFFHIILVCILFKFSYIYISYVQICCKKNFYSDDCILREYLSKEKIKRKIYYKRMKIIFPCFIKTL